MGLLTSTRETAPCTVTVRHRFEELSAHVRFGEIVEEDRTATITRASALARLWTRSTGDFEFMELCEFSFSEEVMS